MLKAGQVFLGKYPPGTGEARRFFILTNVVAGEATVVWVFTSSQVGDKTVILQPGCHPAITHVAAGHL